MLVGDNRPFVGALLALDTEALAHWQQRRGKPHTTTVDLRTDPDLLHDLQRAVVGANTAVSRAESIRAFRILTGEFTEARGLLTPSLKLRRAAVADTYADDIDALYAEASSSSSA